MKSILKKTFKKKNKQTKTTSKKKKSAKTEKINNTYEAVYNDDLKFDVNKISFGQFNALGESDSTLEIVISGTEKLDNCVLLAFAEDLVHEENKDTIKGSSVSLISNSDGLVPINPSVVEGFENELNKDFVGFVYFEDLEEKNNHKLLYVNMRVDGGKEKGKYVADISLEVFCDN